MPLLFPLDARLQAITETINLPAPALQEDLYIVLLESIVSQQLSVKAADTIFKRFLALFPDAYPAPELLMQETLETLRSVGLSRQKATYLQEVAKFHSTHGMAYADLVGKTDAEIIAYLTQIKGVGKWTVEMLLIFALQRPDVFAVDDLGIQQAIKKLYTLTTEGKELKKQMLELAENWKPNRSLACRYLWRWKDSL
ncbi:MAG: DNA-3-methyladenine glycosylase 2 family protein [Bacteroidetes bacterium]|nr:MAG: DNA-3-methyladenine glycosylase 2 family protein [Bacteroidota bacterium]